MDTAAATFFAWGQQWRHVRLQPSVIMTYSSVSERHPMRVIVLFYRNKLLCHIFLIREQVLRHVWFAKFFHNKISGTICIVTQTKLFFKHLRRTRFVCHLVVEK